MRKGRKMSENYDENRFLGNGYHLDLVSVPRTIVLRRVDGSEVAKFTIWDATSKAIEQAAEVDYRSRQKEPAGL
jgi:hypothetical protein